MPLSWTFFTIVYLTGTILRIQPKFNKIFILNLVVFIILSCVSVFTGIGFYYKMVINIFAAISGMYSIYYFSTKVKINKMILFLDKNSFIIYLFHSPIIYIIYRYFSDINPFLLVTINTLISISGSLALGYILRKLKLSFILGELKK